MLIQKVDWNKYILIVGFHDRSFITIIESEDVMILRHNFIMLQLFL